MAISQEKPAEGLRRATGRGYDEWFALLDEWGAPGRSYQQIAAWLTDEHGVSDWWAQKLIVEYQQERGLRTPGIRPDGTFTVSASKTIGVSVHQLFQAFVDPELRQNWLPQVAMSQRTARPNRSARFDWENGASRMSVVVTALGEHKSQVAVEHERLADPDTAAKTKSFWQEKLAGLKAFMED